MNPIWFSSYCPQLCPREILCFINPANTMIFFWKIKGVLIYLHSKLQLNRFNIRRVRKWQTYTHKNTHTRRKRKRDRESVKEKERRSIYSRPRKIKFTRCLNASWSFADLFMYERKNKTFSTSQMITSRWHYCGFVASRNFILKSQVLLSHTSVSDGVKLFCLCVCGRKIDLLY